MHHVQNKRIACLMELIAWKDLSVITQTVNLPSGIVYVTKSVTKKNAFSMEETASQIICLVTVSSPLEIC